MSLLWSIFIAISPAIAFLCYCYERDRHHGKSFGAKIKVFLLGISSIIPIGIIETMGDYWFNSGQFSTYLQQSFTLKNSSSITINDALFMGFLWSGIIEESIKLLFILLFVNKTKGFANKTNVILYTVILGLGFATLENILYVFSFQRSAIPSLILATTRTFMTLPMHGICAVAMGFFLGRAKFSKTDNKILSILGAWGSATLIHGTYNTLALINTPLSLFLCLLIVLVGIFISIQILRTMNKDDKITSKSALDHEIPSTPTPTQPSLKELARQGNPKAIAAVLNRSLQPKGITVKAILDQRCLQLMLISAQVPAIELVRVIRDGLSRLGIESIEQVKIYGKQAGEDIPDWHQEFELIPPSLATETFAEPVNPPTRTPRPKLTSVKLSAIVALVAISLVGISYFASQVTEIFAANYPRTSSYQSSPSLQQSPQYQAELSAAEQVIQTNPNNHQAWYNKAQALSKLKRYPEALAAYDKALQINQNYIQAWSGRSLTLRKLERFDEALVSANKALQINPNFAEGWKDKCGALWTLKRHPEALAACDKAVQLQPDFSQAWNNRGLVLTSLKRHEEAFASFDKAVQLKPDYFNAWYQRSKALGSLQRFEEAVASFDKVLELEPNNQYAWAYRGEALAGMQQYREAMNSYAKATQIDPTYRSTWNAPIILERKWREYKKVIASGDLVLQTKLRQSDSWYYRAAFLSDTQDFLASYDKALQINPNNIDAWNGRGSILSDLGEYEEAIAAYDQAIQVNPRFGWAWYNRGLALQELGRYEEALDSYDKAIQSGSFPAVERAREDLRRRLGK
ncbi:MAG TPA: hypothetical protein DDZ80_15845 [Cyanobacteria bacterium UBA8803]|nr:hypothetical protein [Cyanobacteria bacterium UBA9273]HBL59889.1 hypothetical protein [Cyanobacteria bacterium UBA8803]